MKYEPRQLAAADLGYLAGLIDGEGWVGLTKRKRSWKRDPSRTHYHRPVIVIGMATLPSILHSATMLGMGHEAIKSEHPAYRLRIYPNTLRWLLPQLIPHLVLKRRQAEILMEFIKRCKYQGKELTIDEMWLRESLHIEMKSLNERPAVKKRRLAQVS